MYEFLLNQWENVALVLVFIVACLILIKYHYGFYVNKMLFFLVSEAESRYGNGTGELKYAAVATWAYDKLPTLAKILFTPKQVDRLIEAAVDKLQLYLEENASARKVINSPSQPYINC